MEDKPGLRSTKRVNLCSERGPTSIFIDAEIDESGNLVLSGQDVGEAPRRVFDDSDYEYWLTVPAAGKGRVLRILRERAAGLSTQDGPGRRVAGADTDTEILLLLEDLYRGNTCAVSDFRDLLTASGIPFEFNTYS